LVWIGVLQLHPLALFALGSLLPAMEQHRCTLEGARQSLNTPWRTRQSTRTRPSRGISPRRLVRDPLKLPRVRGLWLQGVCRHLRLRRLQTCNR